METKTKNLLRVDLLTESEEVARLLTKALTNSADIEVDSIDFNKPVDSHASLKADVLIICDQSIVNNKLILKKIQREQKEVVQIYVATYKIRIPYISKYLNDFNGCILLDGDLMLLPNIIRMGRDGYNVMPSTTFINIGQERDLVKSLSLYECALLHELAIGHNERAIARKMGTTNYKIKSHLRNLYQKLNVSLSVDAVSFAKRHKDHLHRIRRDLIREERTLLNKG